MTSLFEFLFKYRPLLYQKGSLGIRPFWPPFQVVLLALGVMLAAYLLYRRTESVLPTAWRFCFTGLRALIFLTLLLIFMQPVLILHSVIPQRSFVAVAYDLSKSMEIRDGPGGLSRLDVERGLLAAGNPFLEALGKKFKVRYFRFSGSADRSGAFEDQPRHGNVTDLERSLEQIAGEMGSAPLSGIVLLTDGADNHSSNLNATAAQLHARGIPVYPVGIGSPEFSRDVEVLRVNAPRKVLKDAMVEADVSLRATGYAGQRTRLVVRQRDRVLQSQEITLGSDGEVKTYRVLFTCDSAGPGLFSISAGPFPDEIVGQNNDQNVLIRVTDEQPLVLYVEGEPRWTYGFLRRAALEDKNLHLVTLLRQADGKFLRQGVESAAMLEKGFPTDKAELFRYKGLILGSVEASFFSFDQLRMISDFVSQRGGGFLMLGGRNSFGQGGYVNTPLEDVLPVSLPPAGASEFRDVEFKALLTGYGVDHPVTRVSVNDAENRKRWEAAPALVGLNPTTGVKAGATVLAHGSVAGIRTQNPVLLAFQRFGRGKSMALTTASTWRWRMESDSHDNFHEMFWKQMLRWLVSDVDDQVMLETEKHSYSQEEAVVLRAEVHDSSFIHLNNAQITAQVKAPSGQISTVPLAWDINKEGQYSAAFRPLEEGIYEATAEAFQGAKSLGTAKTNFRVADSLDEFHNASMNVDLLKQLAAETGGRYYASRDARMLPEDISYVDRGASRVEERELWDMPFLFLLLVGLAGTEWAFRKKKGLA